LTIDESVPVVDWGRRGRKLDIHQLQVGFVEGNGINTGPEEDRFVGTGPGATWRCAADEDVSNDERDCAPQDKWNGGKMTGRRSDRITITNGQTGSVEFDLTADVRNGVTRWLIQTKGNHGEIAFFSREGAEALGNFTLKPRLLVTLGN
jgi:hypothetical protein